MFYVLIDGFEISVIDIQGVGVGFELSCKRTLKNKYTNCDVINVGININLKNSRHLNLNILLFRNIKHNDIQRTFKKKLSRRDLVQQCIYKIGAIVVELRAVARFNFSLV